MLGPISCWSQSFVLVRDRGGPELPVSLNRSKFARLLDQKDRPLEGSPGCRLSRNGETATPCGWGTADNNLVGVSGLKDKTNTRISGA